VSSISPSQPLKKPLLESNDSLPDGTKSSVEHEKFKRQMKMGLKWSDDIISSTHFFIKNSLKGTWQ